MADTERVTMTAMGPHGISAREWGLGVGLVGGAVAEVEGIAPAVLVKLRREVVERVGHIGVVRVVLVVAADVLTRDMAY